MKTKINYNLELNKSISDIENQRALEFTDLKHQLKITYQCLKPVSILNRTIDDIRESSKLKNNLMETTFSVAGGYLSKKFLIGSSNSIVKKIFGAFLQNGITSLISKKMHKKN